MKKYQNLALSIPMAILTLALQAQPDAQVTREIWNNHEFQARFIGSYGQLSDVEPRVSREESAFLQGLISVIRDTPKQALVELNNANSESASAVYDFAIGNIHLQEGNPEQARSAYHAALKKYPDFRRVHKNLGLLEIREGRPDAAQTHLTRAAELGDKDSRIYGLLGYGYLQQQKYLPAEAAYRQAILFDPETLDWKLGLTQALLAQHRYSEAVSLLDQLIESTPDREDLWLLQANAFLATDEHQRAATNLEAVRLLGRLDGNGYVLLGDIYLNERMPELALEAYREALQKSSPPKIDTMLRSASILAQLGEADEAQVLAKTLYTTYADKLDKTQRLRLLNLESKIAQTRGDTLRASEILTQIVEEDPLNGEALIQLAQHHTQHDNPQKAIFLLERARNLQTYEAAALVAHAQLLVKQGKYQPALQLLDQSLAIQPSKPIEEYRDRVERAARVLR